jgi:hypothetical protein
VDGNEHREIGDTASGGALVKVGGESAEERFWLRYGDVMALSGDYFLPDRSLGSDNDPQASRDAAVPDGLFSLARVPGKKGTEPETRDEIICALKVMVLARLFHDLDNSHGLAIDAGGVVFGDSYVHYGVTQKHALAAVRAGIDDVEVAFKLGAAGSRLSGERLYRAVRAATGASQDAFLAETKIPRPSTANPPQNWRATDLETLWGTPIVGTAGTTVGEALTDMMQPDGRFIRQLDCLGQGLVEAYGLLGVPIVREWLARKGRQAYTIAASSIRWPRSPSR